MKRMHRLFTAVWLILALTVSAGCRRAAPAGSLSASFAPHPTTAVSSDKQTENQTGTSASPSTVKTTARQTTAAAVSAAATAAAPTAAGSALAAPSVSGKLQVRGTQLTDSRGGAVQLRGVSTHGIAWFPQYINAACFRQLREEWQANVIRLAMYTEEYGGYCSGGDREQLRQLIDRGVSYAAAADMYVIIDWHILSDGNPNRHIDDAAAFFEDMAQKYANEKHVLYEICNEPNGGVSWQDIKAYAERIIGVIRTYDKDAVILVGTPQWSQEVDKAAKDPITKYQNILYTLHFYAATHTGALRDTMAAAIRNGLPVFVSEYGICDASGSGAIDKTQAEQWIAALDRYGVSYVAWNLSNKAETSAVFRSGCQKTSGFVESDLSEAGKWLYRMLRAGKTAPSAASPGTVGSAPAETGKTAAKSSHGTGQGASPACTAVLQNSWATDKDAFFQYQLTVQNRSDAALSGWRVRITFNQPVFLTEHWNGAYTADGHTLTVSPAAYNRDIPAGGTAENIGFIVKGGTGLAIEATSVF